MTDLEDFDRRLREALTAFPAPLRAALIRVLEMPDEERAAAIGDIHREGVMPVLAELLMDLEEEPRLRGLVLAELHRLQARAG